jgi:hypothetical protein
MIYAYRNGFTFKVNANIVGQTLEKLEKEKGFATPADLVEVSRPEKSPTHDLFEWDDKKAAEKYRKDVAYRVINSITVIYEEIIKEPVRAFVNVADSKESAVYNNIKDALSDEVKRNNYLSRVQYELDRFVAKYREVKGFADMLIEAGERLKG